MTQKELLYIEDAIGHEQSIICIIDDAINNLNDEILISFMKDEQKKHTSTKNKLIKILEDKSDE